MGNKSDKTNLYAIRHEHGFVKIGKSDDPRDRLKRIQTACPYELHLLTTFVVVGEWGAVETAIHESYADKRVHGEWFDLPDNEITHLVDIGVIHSKTVKEMPEFTPSAYVALTTMRQDAWIRQGNYKTIKR